MANPRQRRKTKSSTSAARQSRRQKQNLKKHKPLRGPKVLQDAWDRRKTVDQNYAALGLVRSLKPQATGGHESSLATPLPIDLREQPTTPLSHEGPDAPHRGRIVRDSNGNVVSVDLPEEGALVIENDVTPWGKAFDATEIICPHPGRTDMAKALESLSSQKSKTVRSASRGELATLRALVAVHGENISAMAHDRRRNVSQRTEGQIRAAINRAGGFEKLR